MSEVKTIIDLIKQVEVDSKINLIPPKDLLEVEDYNLIKDCYEIIYKYRSSRWIDEVPNAEIQQDIILLQSSLVLLAERLSQVSSYYDSSEDRLKVAQSKVRIGLKQAKKDLEQVCTVKISIEDIKDASLALTENLASNLDNIRVGNNFIKYVFYSIRDFVQYLDKCLNRNYKLITERIDAQELTRNEDERRSSFSVSSDSDSS